MSISCDMYFGLFVNVIDKVKKDTTYEMCDKYCKDDLKFVYDGMSGNYAYFGKTFYKSTLDYGEVFDFSIGTEHFQDIEEYKKEIQLELEKWDIIVDVDDIRIRVFNDVV